MNIKLKSPAFILGQGLNALGVVRSLGRHNIPIHLFSYVSEDIAYKSRYVDHVHLLINTDNKQSVVDKLIEAANKTGVKPALFFTSDYFLRFVSEHIEQLTNIFHIQIAGESAIETVTNKAKFADFTKHNNLPAPTSYVPKTTQEILALAETIIFPVLLKPSKSYDWSTDEFYKKYGNKKVIRINNKNDLIETWSTLRDSSEGLLIQEMISGNDDQHYSYCTYRRPQQGDMLSICVNKIRVLPIHGGAGSFLQVVNNAEMEDIAHKTLEALQYVGVASVCFKINSKTNQPQIHEVNGRLPQWHSIFQACGIDLPYIMYRDMIGSPVPMPIKTFKKGKWAALGMDIYALLEYRNNNELGLWQWMISYYNVKACAEFAWDDWGPFRYFLKSIVIRVLKKIRLI